MRPDVFARKKKYEYVLTNNAYAYYHSVVDKRASSSRQDKTSPKLGVNAGLRREDPNKEVPMKHAIFNVLVLAVAAPIYVVLDYLKRR